MLWTVPLLAVSLAAVGYAAGASEDEVCETWYGDQYFWMEESNAPKQKSAALGAGIGVGVHDRTYLPRCTDTSWGRPSTGGVN